MKNPFRRFARKKPAAPEDMEVIPLAPLAHLVDPVEPDPQVLARIEAVLDHERLLPESPDRQRRSVLPMLILALLFGLSVGLILPKVFAPRHNVVMRTNTTDPWVPSGTVALSGDTLHPFLQRRCKGRRHLFITLHHPGAGKAAGEAPPQANATGEDEKMRIDCIFSPARPVDQVK